MNTAGALARLFEYQQFDGNGRLQTLIDETEARYLHALSDDDLEWVSAAGEETERQDKKDEKTDG